MDQKHSLDNNIHHNSEQANSESLSQTKKWEKLIFTSSVGFSSGDCVQPESDSLWQSCPSWEQAESRNNEFNNQQADYGFVFSGWLQLQRFPLLPFLKKILNWTQRVFLPTLYMFLLCIQNDMFHREWAILFWIVFSSQIHASKHGRKTRNRSPTEGLYHINNVR